MLRNKWAITLMAAALQLFVTNVQGGGIPMPTDSTLYTTYDTSPAGISWYTCGTTGSGCYGGGYLPANNPCALLEDKDRITKATADEFDSERYVYLMTAEDAKNPRLTVYLMKYHVTPSYATTTFSLVRRVKLSNLVGGNGVQCYAAANGAALYLGTNASDNAVMVQKYSYVTSPIGGFSPPSPVSGISADNMGYVTVNFGEKNSYNTDFYMFGPDGLGVEVGGGHQYLPNTLNTIPFH